MQKPIEALSALPVFSAKKHIEKEKKQRGRGLRKR
jgi:hypothetical protein